jgi:hypothetical protein
VDVPDTVYTVRAAIKFGRPPVSPTPPSLQSLPVDILKPSPTSISLVEFLAKVFLENLQNVRVLFRRPVAVLEIMPHPVLGLIKLVVLAGRLFPDYLS